MYDATDDPYTYENSTVLVNKLDLRDQGELDDFEAEITNARAGSKNPPSSGPKAAKIRYRFMPPPRALSRMAVQLVETAIFRLSSRSLQRLQYEALKANK
jgi:hypothetical protein